MSLQKWTPANVASASPGRQVAVMLGITIRATGETEAFWRLVDAVSVHETMPSMRQLGYPAHLTLTRYDRIAREALIAALALFDDEPPFSLTFDAIETFDIDPLVLWLKPRAEPRLFQLHRRLNALLGEDRCDPHYRPDQWQRHCTLAIAVAAEHADAARHFARQAFAPFSLVFDAADALCWPPPVAIGTRVLVAR